MPDPILLGLSGSHWFPPGFWAPNAVEQLHAWLLTACTLSSCIMLHEISARRFCI